MTSKFKQLTKDDRHLIAALKLRKLTNQEIADEVGCHERTIRRELKRGVAGGRSYNATDPHQKKLARRKRLKYLGMKIDKDDDLRQFVVAALYDKQRPEAIEGRLKNFHPELASITAKSIYNWLYAPQGQQYAHLLPSHRYKPKRRSKSKARRELIPDRLPIAQRPVGAANRTRYGHTASDTMVSGKKTGSTVAIAGTVERKLRYVALSKIPDLRPRSMNCGLRKNFNAMGIAIHSDVKDNGIENRDHKVIETELGIRSYFCDPYSSWQKGEIEKVFQMVRAEGIPKGMDLSLVSTRQLRAIQDTLNARWRKSLGYYSANELMDRRRAHEKRQQEKKRTADAMRYTEYNVLTTSNY